MSQARDLIFKGFPEDRFERTLAVLREGVADGTAPGFVAGLWRRDDPGVAWVSAVGSRRKEPSVQTMEIGTVFDLASISKVFATASLAALLVERRWLEWDAPVRAFFPSYPYREIRVSDLLSHTAGYAALEPFWQKLRERFVPRPLYDVSVAERQAAMRGLVLAVAPEARVGERALYSDISFLVLGFVLEEAAAMPLDRAVRSLLWEPMGVLDSFYHPVVRSPEADRREEIAATELCPWRGAVLQGQVHDDNCWAMGGYGGHAGVFGGVRDLLHFSRRLLGGFLSREVMARAWSRVSRPTGCERTLGWDTPSGAEPSASLLFSPRSVGHLGFTGTSLWIDPDAGLAVTLLSNRVHPSRENIRIRALRPRFHRAIREDLGR